MKWILGLFLVFAGISCAQAEWDDASYKFDINKSRPAFDRVKRQYVVHVTIENITQETIPKGIRLLIKNATIPVAKSDSSLGDGTPVFNYSEESLSPGESKTISIPFLLQRKALSFDAVVESLVEIEVVSISGKISIPVINSSSVTLSSAGGETIAVSQSNNDGTYHFNVDKKDIDNGYKLIAEGGFVTDTPFEGRLSAVYAYTGATNNANLTAITSLIHKLSGTELTSDSLLHQVDAIKKLDEIGLISTQSWSNSQPSEINQSDLIIAIEEYGLDRWLSSMVTDLADGDLSADLMLGFPNAHGGILDMGVGAKNHIEALKGMTTVEFINTTLYDQSSPPTLSYSLSNTSKDIFVSKAGLITLEITNDAQTESVESLIAVTNTNNGKSRILNLKIDILDTQILAEEFIGPEGGVVHDDWQEVVLTIPEDAVEEEVLFQILSGVSTKGMTIYKANYEVELYKLLKFRTPNYPLQSFLNDNSSAPTQSLIKNVRVAKSTDSLSLVEEQPSEVSWKKYPARFLEIYDGTLNRNASNRLPKNSLNNADDRDYLNIEWVEDAAELISFCGNEVVFETKCGNRDPVLFIHGQTATSPFALHVPSPLGGGEKTWGNFRELIRDGNFDNSKGNQYAVFEFKWRTSARFVDVAADLADAINIISSKTGKKVNIIAHSFGGLLARAYLQELAIDRPFQNDVQSLITFGTPHSGIFADIGNYHGLDVTASGQDSEVFFGCFQLTCNQAGQNTPRVWSVFKDNKYNPVDLPILIGRIDDFNVDKDVPGKLIADLQLTSNPIPVKTKAMIGLTIQRKAFKQDDTYKDTYQDGDALISFYGQRLKFNNENFGLNPISITDGFHSEEILWSHNGAIPGARLPFNEVFYLNKSGDELKHESFEGYRHTVVASTSTGRGDAKEVDVKSDDGYVKTGGNLLNSKGEFENKHLHEGLKHASTWLEANPVDSFSISNLELAVKIINAETQLPVQGAEVAIGIGIADMGTAITNEMGIAFVTVAFYPNTSYVAFVKADTYHPDTFDIGYKTNSTIADSESDFGQIELQSDTIEYGDLTGVVTDEITAQPISNAAITVYRFGGDVQTQTTDLNGSYHFTSLVKGTYEIIAEKGNYIRKVKYSNIVLPNLTNYSNLNMTRNSGLIAHYAFDGNANDVSGNLNHAALIGNAHVEAGSLEIGNNDMDALLLPSSILDGIQDFAVVINFTLDTIHNDFGTQNRDYNTLVSGEQSADGLNVVYEDDFNRFRVWREGAAMEFTGVSLVENKSYNLAIVREGDGITLYLDGLILATQYFGNSALSVADGTFILGQEQDCSGGCFEAYQSLSGSLQDVRIFNRALSELEVKELAKGPGGSDTEIFEDDFNRPDSNEISNGWTKLIDGGDVEILNGELKVNETSVEKSYSGIYRKFEYVGDVSLSAILKETNGYSGLTRRYSSVLGIMGDGTISSGYEVRFQRSDRNYDNSLVELRDQGVVVDRIYSTFQYGPEIEVAITFRADGSIIGSVFEGSSSFLFEFPSRDVSSDGDYIYYQAGKPDIRRTQTLIFQRMDDFSISDKAPLEGGINPLVN